MKNPKNQLIFKITQSNLTLGSLGIRGHNLKYFPGGTRTTKIEAIFENEENPIYHLTYSPKNGLIYGLTGWYNECKAQAGDIIKLKILKPKKSIPILGKSLMPAGLVHGLKLIDEVF